MRELRTLTRKELIETLANIIDTLYLNDDEAGNPILDPNNQWDADTVCRVADDLANLDLIPTKVVVLSDLPGQDIETTVVIEIDGGIIQDARCTDEPVRLLVIDHDTPDGVPVIEEHECKLDRDEVKAKLIEIRKED